MAIDEIAHVMGWDPTCLENHVSDITVGDPSNKTYDEW